MFEKGNFCFCYLLPTVFVAENWKNKQNSFFAAVIKKETFEIHRCNVCAARIHSMGRAALFYYTCTELMNNFNKVMKIKKWENNEQIWKKQSRNENKNKYGKRKQSLSLKCQLKMKHWLKNSKWKWNSTFTSADSLRVIRHNDDSRAQLELNCNGASSPKWPRYFRLMISCLKYTQMRSQSHQRRDEKYIFRSSDLNQFNWSSNMEQGRKHVNVRNEIELRPDFTWPKSWGSPRGSE